MLTAKGMPTSSAFLSTQVDKMIHERLEREENRQNGEVCIHSPEKAVGGTNG
jgi:hypothetical protein